MSAFDLVPEELRLRPQWVVWKLEGRNGKPRKVPYQPSGERANSTDPATWSTYGAVVETARQHEGVGIGFVLCENDPYVGLDLDSCLNGSGLHPDAEQIVREINSYAEYSPSGKGVRILVRATKPGSRCEVPKMPWGDEIGIFDHNRYLTLTGNRLEGMPEEILDRHEELAALYERLFPIKPKSQPASNGSLAPGDQELLERAFKAGNGAKFQKLYGGDWSGYPSQSEADFALCNLLAFWTGPDVGRIDALFRGSGLMRPKWDRVGERTIREVLEGRTEFYDWPKAKGSKTKASTNGSAPSPPPQPPPEVDGLELLENLRGFITKYMVLPSDQVADLLALWVLHTHAFGAACATPYLRIVSATPESGKTLLLEILKELSRNGWHAVNPSPAVLYRKVHAQAPTLLLDEIDNFPMADKTDALAVLNSGYKRGATVDRCEQNGELKEFNCFCPKASPGSTSSRRCRRCSQGRSPSGSSARHAPRRWSAGLPSGSARMPRSSGPPAQHGRITTSRPSATPLSPPSRTRSATAPAKCGGPC
jgi:hypothetical protein